MSSPAPASWSELSAAHRLAARSDWVAACEAALRLRGIDQFLDWMDCYVRPLVGYHIMACGTGVFLAREVNIHRLLLRGVREGVVDQLRDERGTVVLPRAWSGARDGLRPVDLTRFSEHLGQLRAPWSRERLVGAAMERSFGSRQRGSYFLFAAPAGAPAARVDYGMRLLAPHMHDALLSALAGERDGVDERQAVNLTRAERQILDYLVAGHTSVHIARDTFRSPHTVANHIRAIIEKLHARNRTEAIAKALGLGLVMSVDRAPYTRITAAQPMAAYQVQRKVVLGVVPRRYLLLAPQAAIGAATRWAAAPRGWHAGVRFPE
jgi:DNA-binding CsgD family transcriptional regulator